MTSRLHAARIRKSCRSKKNPLLASRLKTFIIFLDKTFYFLHRVWYSRAFSRRSVFLNFFIFLFSFALSSPFTAITKHISFNSSFIFPFLVFCLPSRHHYYMASIERAPDGKKPLCLKFEEEYMLCCLVLFFLRTCYHATTRCSYIGAR
jgi:hypothetical protein